MPVGAYQSTGGDIGTLLRLIQEEKSSSVLNVPPVAETQSPIRALAQGPLLSPEAPGTSRQVSIKPEGNAQADVQPGGVVAPVGAVSNPGGVVGPVAPVAPVMSATQPSSQPSQQVSRPASPSAAPSIATRINPTLSLASPTKTTSAVLGASTKPTSYYAPYVSKQPSTSKVGTQIIVKPPPKPTPTPAPTNSKGLRPVLNQILNRTGWLT